MVTFILFREKRSSKEQDPKERIFQYNRESIRHKWAPDFYFPSLNKKLSVPCNNSVPSPDATKIDTLIFTFREVFNSAGIN